MVARAGDLEPLHVIVQGKHMDVTPALRSYAETKVGKIARYFDQVQDAQVVLSVERRGEMGKAQVVEITVRGDGVVLRGEDASPDMYASIDLVMTKLKKQIEKYRSKMILKRRIEESRRKARLITSAEAALRASPPEARIVRTKRFAMKPMTPEDAVLQMDLLGHDFFVFRNAGTMEVNVVYRRNDGAYAWAAELGVQLEPRQVRVAAQQRSEQAASVEQGRLKFVGLTVSALRNAAEVKVHLEDQGLVYEGISSGPNATRNRLDLVAEATLRALELYLRATGLFLLDGVTLSTIGSHEVVVVVVSLAGREEETLAGSSLVRDDPREAVVRAILDATNRPVSWLLGR